MGRNLTNLYISQSFEYLVQVSGSGFETGLGSSITSVNITASNAVSASFAVSSSNSATSISSSYSSVALSSSFATSAQTATTANSATNATSASFAVTASYALNAGVTVNTASLLTTASAANNVITFTKGDSSQFTVTVATGSAATVNTGSLLVTASISNATTTFTKGDGSQFSITANNVVNANTASYVLNAVSSSFATNAATANSATSASYVLNAVSASFATSAATATSASFATSAATATSASFATNAATATSSSFATSAASATSASFATNATSAATASFLPSTTNLNITSISASTAVFQSASIGYLQTITGSILNIGESFIVLNTSDTTRYAGIKVEDSGSGTPQNYTASFQFDSQTNDWFYEYSGSDPTNFGVAMFGPEYATIGSPTYLTDNRLSKGNGGHHLNDSTITDNGTNVTFTTPIAGTAISASTGFSGNLTGTASFAISSSVANLAITGGGLISGTGGGATTAMRSAPYLTATPATASGGNSIALGSGAYTLGAGSVAIGTATQAAATRGVAIGNTVMSSGLNAVAIGYNVTASGTNGININGIFNFDGTNIRLSNSTIVTGSVTANSFTGSLLGTASFATTALSASYAPAGNPFPFTGSAGISGSLILDGNIVTGNPNNISIGLRSAVIAGGAAGVNIISDTGQDSVIAGGAVNVISGSTGFIGGGRESKMTGGIRGGMVGGFQNIMSGGDSNFIGGGGNHLLSGSFSSILAGAANILTGSTYSAIVGGNNNRIDAFTNTVIIGGANITATANNTVYVPNLVITGSLSYAGTVENAVSSSYPFKKGDGLNAVAAAYYSASFAPNEGDLLIGGQNNKIQSNRLCNAIVGGINNTMSGNAGYASGIFSSYESSITNGGLGTTIIGGANNTFNENNVWGGIMLGGYQNTHGANNGYTFMLSGQGNTITTGASRYSGIVGGQSNQLDSAPWSVIIGGSNHSMTNDGNVQNGRSVIVGGRYHTINPGINSAIIGGNNHTIGAFTGSVILGGSNITAAADNTVYVPNLNVSGSFTGTVATASFANTSSFVNTLNQAVRITGSLVITGSVQGNVSALSITSNTASLNCASNNFFTLTLAASTSTYVNPTNIQPGQTINLRVTQADPTGAGQIAFPSSVKQVSGSQYVPTLTAGGVDIVTFIAFDASSLYLSNVKNFVASV